MYLNSVTIGGRLTRDPELRHTAAGQTICKFGVALGRKYRDRNNEQQEEVTFVDVTCWQKLAENVAKYMAKGKQVVVLGRLKFDTWEDKEGRRRSKLYINATDVQFIDWKNDSRSAGNQYMQNQPSASQQSWNNKEDHDPGDPPF